MMNLESHITGIRPACGLFFLETALIDSLPRSTCARFWSRFVQCRRHDRDVISRDKAKCDQQMDVSLSIDEQHR
jgi:hypothetical protein